MTLKDVGTAPAQQEQEEINYYYDSHPTREDLMGESIPQFNLILHLVGLLRWLYRDKPWFIAGNLNVYTTKNPHEYPLAPDVAVFKDVIVSAEEQGLMRSWKMYQPNRPAPAVVFEVSSDDTWKDDLNRKPAGYRRMGVKEYFAYDPNQPGLWRPKGKRLRGWSYRAGDIRELTPDEAGWLWSEELEVWLAPHGPKLELYDRDRQLLLTEAESAQAAKEQERLAKERAWNKLRELGIDPEHL